MTIKNNHLRSKKRWAIFAEYRLDLELHQLYRGNERVQLPARAGQVLGLLLQNHGVLVSRDQIAEAVWGSRHVDFESSLNTAIRSIRRVLKDDASNPSFIETAPRHGYRFLQVAEFSDAAPNITGNSTLQVVFGPYLKPAMAVVFTITALIIVIMVYWLSSGNFGSEDEQLAMQSYLESPGYEDFLHGRYALSQGETETAELRLAAALQADPSLAPAYVSLGRINIGRRKQGWDRILEAQNLVDKAIQVDPDLVAAHVLKAGIALYYWRDHTLARAHIKKALAVAPDDPRALVVSAYLNVITGNTDKALQAIAKAHQLYPLSPTLNADYGWILYKAGNWNAAERMCKTSVELNMQSQFALDCVIHINHSQGDYAEAAEFGLQLMALRGALQHEIDAIRETVEVKKRETAYWEWTLEWLDANTMNVSDSLSKKGIVLTMLGQHDEAIRTFEEAYAKNGEPFLAFLAVDPRVDGLQAHEGYAALAVHSQRPLARN